MKKKFLFRLSAAQLILLSFIGLILLGTILLNLPIASHNGRSVGMINALFTATSASCVTGLVVVNTLEHWTLFGQLVILGLIQFGALGFISVFTASLLLFNRRLSLDNRIVVQTAFGQDQIGGMGHFIGRVVAITLGTEAVGALLLTFFFHQAQEISWRHASYEGVFHAISAFCNAGFDILGATSLMPFNKNWWILITIGLLIVLGGLGFPVIIDIIMKVRQHRSWQLHRRLEMLSLHSKIVLTMTGLLLATSLLFFLLLEWQNQATLGSMTISHKVLNSLFQAITLRTAGYYSIDQAQMTDLSKLLSSLLMLIGGSPAGTAGGIKTVTLAVVLIAVHSALRGQNQIVAFNRVLPLSLLQRALTVFVIFVVLVLTAVTILSFSEQTSSFKHGLLDLVYEVSSALGTVGLTTGITPALSDIGKLVIAACMLIGRLSPVTVIVALTHQMTKQTLHYPQESVIIG